MYSFEELDKKVDTNEETRKKLVKIRENNELIFFAYANDNNIFYIKVQRTEYSNIKYYKFYKDGDCCLLEQVDENIVRHCIFYDDYDFIEKCFLGVFYHIDNSIKHLNHLIICVTNLGIDNSRSGMSLDILAAMEKYVKDCIIIDPKNKT